MKADFRLARRTTSIGGVEITAGTPVMLLNGAANRDPRHFECPAEFRDRPSQRPDPTWRSAGASTPAPAARLARAEGRVSIERILDRTRNIRLSEEHHGPPGARRFRYEPTWILRGLSNLHLEFDAAEAGPVSRVAVVTGGASGIGLGVARGFVADGYRVALLDRVGAAAESAADELRRRGATAVAVEVDVADRASVDAGFDRIRTELGPVEILVTSAGIESFTPVLDITADGWDRIIGVNLTGTFTCIQAALADMIERRVGPDRHHLVLERPVRAPPTWPTTRPPRVGSSP